MATCEADNDDEYTTSVLYRILSKGHSSHIIHSSLLTERGNENTNLSVF